VLVLGVDPGTAVTGYGLVRQGTRLEALEYGVIRTSSNLSLSERLLVIHEELTGVLGRHRVDLVAVEQVFFSRNVRTALAVGQARGVVLLTAAAAGVPVSEYTPLEVKDAVTGYGRADKRQVQAMVRSLLGLPSVPRPDDAADALAVAICGVHSRTLERMLSAGRAGRGGPGAPPGRSGAPQGGVGRGVRP